MSLIIDPGCHENLCAGTTELPTENNFTNETDDIYKYVYIFIVLFILLKVIIIECILKNKCFINKYTSYNKKLELYTNIVWYITLIEIIIITMYIINYYITREINICTFNDNCYYQNNALEVKNLYYKLINTKCPKRWDEILYMYSDEYETSNFNQDIACEQSNFGCCKINVQCELTGYGTLNMLKDNMEGTNCPDIIEIILGVTKIHNTNIYNQFLIILCIYQIIILFIMIYICCRKEKKHIQISNNEENI